MEGGFACVFFIFPLFGISLFFFFPNNLKIELNSKENVVVNFSVLFFIFFHYKVMICRLFHVNLKLNRNFAFTIE